MKLKAKINKICVPNELIIGILFDGYSSKLDQRSLYKINIET